MVRYKACAVSNTSFQDTIRSEAYSFVRRRSTPQQMNVLQQPFILPLKLTLPEPTPSYHHTD
jgi:hypothetical protein